MANETSTAVIQLPKGKKGKKEPEEEPEEQTTPVLVEG